MIFQVNGTWILKSGTDFRQFSLVTLDFTEDPIEVSIEAVDVTAAAFEPDNELNEELSKYSNKMEDELCKGKMLMITLGQGFFTFLAPRTPKCQKKFHGPLKYHYVPLAVP